MKIQGTSILYIGNKLSRHGFTPGVIETLGPLLEQEGYRVYYAGSKKNMLSRLVEILWKAATIGRRVDYILIDTYSTSAFWYAHFTGLLARLVGTRYIPILHGGDLAKRLANSKYACKRLFNNSYSNIAVSDFLHYEFEKQGYSTIVTPNTIEIKKYPFKLRDSFRPRLLWVRSFHRQYNPKMAADVLANLLKLYPDAELCMVGPDKDGSMEDFKGYVRGKGIENQVRIKGKLTKEQWVKLSVDYDFFINTTNVDNTPVSVIEAMALGMCIISTNPGGIPFLLDDGTDSVLVGPGDSLAMAEKIIEIIANPSLGRELSNRARRKAQHYDWEHVKQKWHELLQ